MKANFQSLLATLVLAGLVQVAAAGEIHEAAWRGNVQKLETLLKENPKLANAPDQFSGAQPLWYAIRYNHPKAVEILIQNGADANRVPANGVGAHNWTPLQNAMFSAGDEIVEMLLKHGAKCGIVEAAALGKLEIIKKLLGEDPTLIEKRSNFGFSGEGGTPLYWAVARGRTNVVEYLLRNKADVNTKGGDDFKRTPLLMAVCRGDLDMVKLLLANGANAKAVDSMGWTGLHCIANAGPKYGSLPKDPKPLDWTASQTQLDIAQLLLDHGAEVNAKDGLNRTPLRAALNPGGAVENFADFLRKKGGKEE